MVDEKRKCDPPEHHTFVGEHGGASLTPDQSATCECGEMTATLGPDNKVAVSTSTFSGTIPLASEPGPSETWTMVLPSGGTDE